MVKTDSDLDLWLNNWPKQDLTTDNHSCFYPRLRSKIEGLDFKSRNSTSCTKKTRPEIVLIIKLARGKERRRRKGRKKVVLECVPAGTYSVMWGRGSQRQLASASGASSRASAPSNLGNKRRLAPQI